MATNTIDLEIRAKTDQVAAELAKLGKLSDKQVREMAKSITKHATDMEKAQVKAAKETEKNWTNATKKIASTLGEGVIPKFEKLSGLGESLGSIMGASALQVATLTAGVGALAAGAIYLNSTIDQTVANLDAEVAAVSDVQRAMSASAIDAIRPYAEAHKAAKDAIAGVKFELAAITGTFDKTDAAFYTGAEFILHYIRTGEGMEEWSRKTVAALNRAEDAARKATRYFPNGPESISAEGLYAVPEMLAAPSGGAASKSPRVAAAKAEAAALADEQRDLDALYIELAQRLAGEEAAANLDRVESAREAARQRMEIAQEDAAYREKLEQDAAAAAKMRAAEIADAHTTIANNVGAFVGGLGSLISDLYTQAADNAEKGSARERKARRAAFATAKAAALVQAGINTALAVTQALTLPVPLNYINAAIVGALGAVEVGLIAAKQMPVAHTGKMLAPDEVPFVGLRGEAVLSRQAVEDMGGEQAVSNANRRTGRVGGENVGVFAMTYEHRSYDAFVRRDLRRPSGVMRQALHNAGTAGLLTRGG